jgi:hypothetical protein
MSQRIVVEEGKLGVGILGLHIGMRRGGAPASPKSPMRMNAYVSGCVPLALTRWEPITKDLRHPEHLFWHNLLLGRPSLDQERIRWLRTTQHTTGMRMRMTSKEYFSDEEGSLARRGRGKGKKLTESSTRECDQELIGCENGWYLSRRELT